MCTFDYIGLNGTRELCHPPGTRKPLRIPTNAHHHHHHHRHWRYPRGAPPSYSAPQARRRRACGALASGGGLVQDHGQTSSRGYPRGYPRGPPGVPQKLPPSEKTTFLLKRLDPPRKTLPLSSQSASRIVREKTQCYREGTALCEERTASSARQVDVGLLSACLGSSDGRADARCGQQGGPPGPHGQRAPAGVAHALRGPGRGDGVLPLDELPPEQGEPEAHARLTRSGCRAL